jgi:hypothetical protein
MNLPLPTTELEAVNFMLASVGEAPVNSLNTSGLVDASLARDMLNYASRETQKVGWHWNTEVGYPINRNQNGELVLPVNTIKVDTTGQDQPIDVVQRGNRLYDRRNHTFIFETDVKVEIVLLLPFDEIPQAARDYIVVRATRRFQANQLGAGNDTAFTSQHEIEAFAYLREAEIENTDANMLTDSYSVFSIINRRIGS